MSNLPFGYLLPILFLAWCTYFVVAPSHWPRTLRSLGIYFEVINEVPFFALFWIISATIWAFIEGDLAHPIGKIAFGLALLVVGGLVVIIYWGLQSAAPWMRVQGKVGKLSCQLKCRSNYRRSLLPRRCEDLSSTDVLMFKEQRIFAMEMREKEIYLMFTGLEPIRMAVPS